MSDECDTCGEHTLECKCKENEDIYLRNLLYATPSELTPEEGFEISLKMFLEDDDYFLEKFLKDNS